MVFGTLLVGIIGGALSHVISGGYDDHFLANTENYKRIGNIIMSDLSDLDKLKTIIQSINNNCTANTTRLNRSTYECLKNHAIIMENIENNYEFQDEDIVLIDYTYDVIMQQVNKIEELSNKIANCNDDTFNSYKNVFTGFIGNSKNDLAEYVLTEQIPMLFINHEISEIELKQKLEKALWTKQQNAIINTKLNNYRSHTR